jgi:hypothetical protein
MQPPPLLVGVGDDACYRNTDSSPATSAHPVCRALNAHALSEWPLLAGCAGGKGSNNDGGTGGSGQSWIAHRISMVLPSPSGWQRDSNKDGGQVKAETTMREIATPTRVASNDNDNGNGNGGKSNGDSNKGGGQATTRAMVAATTVAGNNEGNGNGNEQATKRVRAARQ